MTSSFKEIILIAIGSLILVETTASSKVHCNPNILRQDERLNCIFKQDWAFNDPGDLGKCTCSGRPCMTLSHASVKCNSNANWSLVNDNPTANAWGDTTNKNTTCGADTMDHLI
ncbi:uncharacterized protein LOC132204463 isoform X2 [Neocloeon triangulifer]|uniref:uncharacterized protein LOC132204463 isoform X2 n=1 Tax=Neocloeon triangulifer TaxID=2078957 RepID=UPI00286F4FF3|nr:uncharacterized protein LOC132204463 isoform X2 [Neocloeon triangulifer]